MAGKTGAGNRKRISTQKGEKRLGIYGNILSVFPPLYQRVRAYNVTFYKNRNKEQYEKSLQHLIETAKNGKMFGEWIDYGRLLIP